jgi:hypothetical protein
MSIRTNFSATAWGIEANRSAPINASASGDNTVITGVGGKRIVVLGYHLVCAGAVAITWKSSGGWC